jgi:uncharacterized phage protein (TIGR02220 family)
MIKLYQEYPLNINASSLKEIITIQKEKRRAKGNYYFDYNRFLSFSLALSLKKQTVISTIVKELNMKEEELELYKSILAENSLINSEDLKLIEKITTKSTTKIKNFSLEIEEIIQHLNRATGRNFRISKDNEKRIKTLLSSNKFTVSDFKKVNVYFTKIWSSNPDMAKYLRPATLYNSKFETRLEESEFFFEELNKYEKTIQNICHEFHSIISLEVYGENRLIASETQVIEDFCNELPISLQESIIHWIKKGYTEEQIIEVIKITKDSWSKKPELEKHISVSKILDQKFPERAKIVERILSKQNESTHKTGVISAEDWLKQKEKE